MAKDIVLLVDDEQIYLEALADALEYQGHSVLKAATCEEGLRLLEAHRPKLVTVDIMMPAGPALEGKVDSQRAGVFFCEEVARRFPETDIFCISVVNDPATIRKVQKLGARFFRKGETPLRTVLDMIESRLTGIAYSDERRRQEHGRSGES